MILNIWLIVVPDDDIITLFTFGAKVSFDGQKEQERLYKPASVQFEMKWSAAFGAIIASGYLGFRAQ